MALIPRTSIAAPRGVIQSQCFYSGINAGTTVSGGTVVDGFKTWGDYNVVNAITKSFSIVPGTGGFGSRSLFQRLGTSAEGGGGNNSLYNCQLLASTASRQNLTKVAHRWYLYCPLSGWGQTNGTYMWCWGSMSLHISGSPVAGFAIKSGSRIVTTMAFTPVPQTWYDITVVANMTTSSTSGYVEMSISTLTGSSPRNMRFTGSTGFATVNNFFAPTTFLQSSSIHSVGSVFASNTDTNYFGAIADVKVYKP